MGASELPSRRQTLRGAIAWSYDILDEGARRLLDRLSVFAGTCDLETADARAVSRRREVAAGHLPLIQHVHLVEQFAQRGAVQTLFDSSSRTPILL